MVFVFYIKFSKLTFLNLYFFHPRNKRKLLEFQSWVATVKLFFMKKLVHCSIPFRNCSVSILPKKVFKSYRWHILDQSKTIAVVL